MKRKKIAHYFLSVLTLSLLASPAVMARNLDINPYIQAPQMNHKSDNKLNFRFYQNEDNNTIYISANRSFSYEVSPLTDSHTLIIDTFGASVNDIYKAISTDFPVARQVRFDALSNGGIRLFIDMHKPFKYTHRLMDRDRTLELNISAVRKAPAFLRNKTVVIDPGHGGSRDGAIGLYRTKEKDINLAVAKIVWKMLEDDGIKVIMTRKNDSHIDLDPRAYLANRTAADIFVSIHANSNVNRTPNGIETYYRSAQSRKLSEYLHKNLIKATGALDRGIKTANFVVIKKTKMPSVLLEIGFVSNPHEEKLLASPAYQKKIATAIYNGIREYLEDRSF